jgi:transcriptional regulator
MVYLPPAFTETRREILIGHIERYEFGLLVTTGGQGMVASHVPFLVERRAEAIYLQGHLARPNPQVADLAAGGEAMAVFAGPHAYVSPRWYASGPAVPTWNYADVHAYGRVRAIEEASWLETLLSRLSERQEALVAEGEAPPWRVEDQPSPFLAGMMRGIVGFEIAVARLEGKFKLSQNRPAADQARVAAALERAGDGDGRAVARLMRERTPG